MERCYVCNSCGKCADEARDPLTPVCQACGHEIQPGESTVACVQCGSTDIARPEVDLSDLFG